jgi:hypothetical protein
LLGASRVRGKRRWFRSFGQRRAAAVRKNHGQAIKDPADQLFCGDPDLKTQGRRAIYFELVI